MPALSSVRFAPWLLQALPTAFLAILFLQSGIDKVIDFRGDQGWPAQHFGNSPLRGVVTPMLVTLTVVEVSAGLSARWGWWSWWCSAFRDRLLGPRGGGRRVPGAVLRPAHREGLHRGGGDPRILLVALVGLWVMSGRLR